MHTTLSDPLISGSLSRKPAARETSGSETSARPRILYVGSLPEDRLALNHILDGTQWLLSVVTTCQDAIQRLRTTPVSAIFCESELEDGTWKEILDGLNGCCDAPPLIVTSRMADEYLWAEVLNLGGCDVLAKPFSGREVRHVLETVSLRGSQSSGRVRHAGAA